MKLRYFFIFIKWSFLALVFLILVVNIIVHLSSAPYSYKKVADVPQEQTALILGAAITPDGTLSTIFQSRVDKAIELYKNKKVSKILASGDNGTVAHNEVNPVRDYLIAHDIPEGDIFLDHAGFDTYSTMYRARDIFEVSSVIVVTQSFHLPRAVFIARALGIKAYGISSDEPGIAVSNYVREVFADEKAAFELVFHIKPKFLGDKIPITGTQ